MWQCEGSCIPAVPFWEGPNQPTSCTPIRYLHTRCKFVSANVSACVCHLFVLEEPSWAACIPWWSVWLHRTFFSQPQLLWRRHKGYPTASFTPCKVLKLHDVLVWHAGGKTGWWKNWCWWEVSLIGNVYSELFFNKLLNFKSGSLFTSVPLYCFCFGTWDSYHPL